MNTSRRNVGLDIFRIIMMFGICLIHSCGQGAYKNVTLHNMVLPCVVGFAMLSGYFGLRFTPSKLLRLYALAIGYCFVIPIIGQSYGDDGYLRSVISTWGAPWRYWYLHAYAALFCLSPALKCEKLGRIQPFVGIVFVWGFLTAYNSFSDVIPRAAGFGSHTFVTLLGVYLFARIAKEQGWFDRMPFWTAIISSIVSLLILAFVPGSGLYNSPVAALLSFSLLAMFRRIRTIGRLDAIVVFLAPSMFGVYLLHCAIVFPGVSPECYGLINWLESFHVGKGMSCMLSYFVVALEVFVISLCFELIRRMALYPVRTGINAVLDRIDTFYKSI